MTDSRMAGGDRRCQAGARCGWRLAWLAGGLALYAAVATAGDNEAARDEQQDYQEAAESRAAEIDAEIADLATQRDKAAPPLKRQMASYLITLAQQRTELARELQSLHGISEERWHQQVSEVESAFADIRRTFGKLARDLQVATTGIRVRSPSAVEARLNALDDRLRAVETNMTARLDTILGVLRELQAQGGTGATNRAPDRAAEPVSP